MNGGEQRYCPACGALLTPGAALCGECGARFQESPFARSSADAPGAWAAPPRPREAEVPAPPQDEAPPQIAHAPRGAWESGQAVGPDRPAQPVADRPGSAPAWGSPAAAPAPVWGSPSAAPSGAWEAPASAAPAAPSAPSAPAGAWGSPAPAEPSVPSTAPSAPLYPGPGGASPARQTPPPELEPPLDGCEVAGIAPRLGAWLIDSVISTLVSVPFVIGIVLILQEASAGLVAQILTGVGVALIAAWTIVSIWLLGARALSPGLAICGLRVVRARTGKHLGFVRALGRAVVFGLPFVHLISAIMILVDSRTRRGLHDRAVDAIVLDVRRGRNPLLARPDDYARAGAEHYLPQAPVPVSAHANLLTRPGSPWGLEEGAESAWDAPAAVAAGEGAVIERSPWEPTTGEMHRSSASTASPAAPEASDDVEAAAAPDEAEIPSAWTEPAPAESAPARPVPAERASAQSVAPQAAPAPLAEEWESTRVPAAPAAQLGDEDDDLDRTRVASRPLSSRRIALTLDGEEELEVVSPVALGRNPSAPSTATGAEEVALADSTRSISKTHLLLEVRDGAVVATDLGSTNGTAVVDGDEPSLLAPHEPRELGAAAVLALGDRTLDVRLVP